MPKAKFVSPGRPTREQQKARQAALLEAALDQFLEKGFEQATIEAIAGQVLMTKRTIYARYPDKAALFQAAVARAIERYSLAPADLVAACSADVEQTLVRIAHLRADLVRTPNGLKLQRIVNAEAYRFPNLLTDFYEVSLRPVTEFVADLLRHNNEAGELSVDQPMDAAVVFLSMVLGGPVRQILAGQPVSDEELDKRIRFAVRLFLDGARRRPDCQHR